MLSDSVNGLRNERVCLDTGLDFSCSSLFSLEGLVLGFLSHDTTTPNSLGLFEFVVDYSVPSAIRTIIRLFERCFKKKRAVQLILMA